MMQTGAEHGIGVRVLVALIRVYQQFSAVRPPVCRFQPTCSHYTILALKKYGVARGLWMGLRRLLRCHPWHPGGYDPL
jgi:uncharacterized protein